MIAQNSRAIDNFLESLKDVEKAVDRSDYLSVNAYGELLNVSLSYFHGGWGTSYENGQGSTWVHLLPTEENFLVPWNSPVLPLFNEKSAIKRLALIADRLVFILPMDLSAELIPSSNGSPNIYSLHLKGEGQIHMLAEILDVNMRFAKQIASGDIIFLPRSIDRGVYDDGLFDNLSGSYTIADSRVYLESNKPNLIPLTPTNNIIQNPLFDLENTIVLNNILLPYFPDFESSKIKEIVSNETEAFNRFRHFLREKAGELLSSDNTNAIGAILEEIDYQTSLLKIEAEKIKRLKSLERFSLGFFTISMAFLLSPSNPFPKELPAILGSTSMLNLVRNYIETQNKQLDLRKSDFFIPFTISSDKE